MKKVFMLMMVILLVFAVGCAQKTVVEQQPAPSSQPPAETPTTTETQPAQTEPVVEPEEESLIVAEPEEDSDGYDWESIPKSERREITSIRARIDKALAKDENYFYRYTGPDQYQYEYWVKGDKLKIQVLEEDKLDKTTIKNIVYIDEAKKSAGWYCEHSNMNFCFSGPGPWPATVKEFYRMTPKDWMGELGQNFRYKFNDQMQGVTYNIIDYTVEGKLVRVWLDSWNGYPYLIEFHPDLDPESDPVKSYKFEDLELGGLSDADVTPKV